MASNDYVTVADECVPKIPAACGEPSDEAAQLRMVAQLLDRIVLALQFLFGERRMDRGVADSV